MAQRKVLCLHGAQLSAEIFKMQLFPYLDRLESEYNLSFHFANGPILTTPEASIAPFWDQPCYRFFHWSPSPIPFNMRQLHASYEYLYAIIAEHGPFDGVAGFSQGAVTAVALLLHHAARQESHNPEASSAAKRNARPLFKFAILFSVPHLAETDEDGSKLVWGKIGVPSLHICGEKDEEWFWRSKQLFEGNCEAGTAKMIVHGGGHLVPKDKATVDRVVHEIGELLQRVDAA